MSKKLNIVFDDPGSGWVGLKMSCGGEVEIFGSVTPIKVNFFGGGEARPAALPSCSYRELEEL